jgi:hypothetical protein
MYAVHILIFVANFLLLAMFAFLCFFDSVDQLSSRVWSTHNGKFFIRFDFSWTRDNLHEIGAVIVRGDHKLAFFANASVFRGTSLWWRKLVCMLVKVPVLANIWIAVIGQLWWITSQWCFLIGYLRSRSKETFLHIPYQVFCFRHA